MNAEEVEVLKETLQAASFVPAKEETAVDLRNRDASLLLGGELVAVMTPYPRLYAWAPASTQADDGVGALRPSLIPSSGSGRWLLISRGMLYTRANINPPNLVDGDHFKQALGGPTGAELGDFVMIGFDVDLQGIMMTAYVSAFSTVTVVFQNETGGAIDLGLATAYITVFKK